MNPMVLIVGGLITWRLANLISKQSGPLAIFARFRAFLASRQKKTGGLYDIVSCMSCASMIMGAVTALALAGSVLEWFVYVLSFSAIAVLVDALIKKQ